MTREGALNELQGLQRLLGIASSAIRSEKTLQGSVTRLEARLKECTDKQQSLRISLRDAMLLLNYYSSIVPEDKLVGICPECNGYGGHSYDTQEGYACDPCQLCEETGLVPKAFADEWEAKNKQQPEPTLQVTESNKDLDLPF